MFETFIWDFDGTLFDTYPMITPAYLAALADYNIQADPKEIYQILKEESSSAVARKYQLDFAEFTQKFRGHEKEYDQRPKSFAGTKETLAEISKNGGQNMILTHRSTVSTQALLKGEGLQNFFTEIVGPENHFPRKPDPASLNYLLDKYQLVPEKTAMIGDRLLDVEAGKNAGVQTIFFDNEAMLKNITADHRVSQMAEITRFI